ncbi:MAG: hypothetical protein E7220_04770 [Clostridiales bacterium]|nr:hypothetical protein [Clostridiales bacterium]
MIMEGLIIENGVVKDGKTCEGIVTVPEGVTEIARQAFYKNKALTGLILPEGLKKIGAYSVNGCVNLEFIDVPDSLEELGEDALVRKTESNVTFKHTIDSKMYMPEIRCTEGSYVDNAIKEILSKDGLAPSGSHSNEHVVKVVYK